MNKLLKPDAWHYGRQDMAEQVLNMFDSGLSSALTFFAPRRMGKTEFLRKDIMPLAEERGWLTFYFSFLDVASTAEMSFDIALGKFALDAGLISKTHQFLKKINQISAGVGVLKADIKLQAANNTVPDIKALFQDLSESNRVLLLLDEIQVLALQTNNDHFIAALRTALDMHKDKVKVIFTGSSREGLRRMFSQSSAPFFHFGQNLPFPELEKGFTDHLAAVFQQITTRSLDTDELWLAFQNMGRVPQLARSLVERLTLNPNDTLAVAKQQLLDDIIDDREYLHTFNQCSLVEQMLLKEIAGQISHLFSENTRQDLAKKLGISELPVSTLQSNIRSLQKKNLIGRLPERGGYFIDDPNFKSWLLQQ